MSAGGQAYTTTWTPGVTQLPTIDISGVAGYGNKLPNKKLSINIHEAHGGYIVEIVIGSLPGDLYIIGEDQDIGQELGKIITHRVLTQKHD